jgi:hypothetical protein
MRWMLLIVIATVASICLAEQPEIPGCDHASAVVCFVDRAQARLHSCLSSTIPPDAARTENAQRRSVQDDTQRRNCVTASHREIDPLYREALNAVRYQRGTTRAVTDYYEDWDLVLSGRGAPLAADSTTAGDSRRADIEHLNVKAEHLRQAR